MRYFASKETYLRLENTIKLNLVSTASARVNNNALIKSGTVNLLDAVG
jgi:hypothetical protein